MGVDYGKCDKCGECYPDCGDNYPERCVADHSVCPWCIRCYASNSGRPDPRFNFDVWTEEERDIPLGEADVFEPNDDRDRAVRAKFCPVCALPKCPHCGQTMP